MKKVRIKKELKKMLGRNPKKAEEINALKDPILMMKLMMEDIEDLEVRVKKLEL